MIQGWLAAFVTLALIASQGTIQEARARLSDEQTTIAALEHPPLPAARAKHRSGARADARRLSAPHAIVPGHIELARADARIAEVSTAFVATSSDARSPHGTQSRAPPVILVWS